MKYCFIGLVTSSLVFFSCNKEKSCVRCQGTNKPPIAMAGPDQVVTLPTNSISLDGSASSDPDGTISKWQWTKISGPSSFLIDQPSSSNSGIQNLVQGAYQFELIVTDNAGLFSKDTMRVIVNDPSLPNRQPVANAGSDLTITLPANSVMLSGTGSTDPDNNIVNYAWTKVSGPVSFIILSSTSAQTLVSNLTEGVYQFELKVTDDGGLFSKDTMQVFVNAAQQTETCNNSNRPQVNAQKISIGNLSLGRAGMATVHAGNKLFFAGSFLTYYNGPGPSYGSTRVDIYDITSKAWSTAELSAARFGIATISAGNKVFFAGGENGDGAFNEVFANVDIYDISTNTWTVAMLSKPRSYVSAAIVGNKVIFAGGEINDSQTSDRIDMYDLSTNTWSVATLSEARAGISAVTVNDKVYFAGGHVTNYWAYIPSKKIDVYDDQTNSWSVSSFSTLTGDVSGIAVGNKIYWAKGCKMEIKDVITGNSTTESLFRPGGWTINDGQNAVLKGNKLLFFRHAGPEISKFDIYDLTTKEWSIGVLPTNTYEYFSVVSVNNTVYMAGGWIINTGGFSTQVWKLEF